ncbi:disease resistance-like protein DSC1 [Eucalyptus grandis]|uniref:disease resistance-like protein DSC1 n=1 Tax=Eucalyptus grandis TaxID=71139 RepID=UPI00192EB9C6|nr:disease resistance-like protein DSC1 [Eucalyptus grandis]
MAHLKATASEVQYGLFLSFSGDDTRYNFIGFLHQGLEKARIRVFRDEDEIKVGDKIGKTILQAIDNSKFYIPIISQTYPDRKWCLIELERMMNNVSRSKDRKRIFPIFYKVEPGDVKHRTPHPENIFSKVELRKFKRALAKVGKIKGWKVHEQQSQIEIVDKVVQKVLEVLGRKEESEIEYPIELDDLTQSLEDSLNLVNKRETSVGREREENRKYKEYVEEEQMRSVGREMEDDGKHMKYVSDEQMRKRTSVGWTRETSRRREREDDKKHMEYVVEEQMRRGTSVGNTREDDGKDMKYVQEKWLRGGTSASRTRGASIRREREDDRKLM